MLSNLSSNAILSKARALYGKCLTKNNYKDLLSCQTVNEVAAYLKSRTVYEKFLSGINESQVHRGQLEAKLKQRLFEDYALLCRYEISVGEHFSQYLILRSEIEQILHSILLINAGSPEEYIFSLPMYLVKHSNINLTALSHVKNFDELLKILEHTRYYKVLEQFKPISDEPINYTGIENSLYTYLYGTVFEAIRKYTRGGTSKQLQEIFNTYIDLINFARIVRLKLFYNSSADFIRSCLLPFGNMSKRTLSELIDSNSADEMNSIFKKTIIGKRYLTEHYAYPDEISNHAKYRVCKHFIHFSTHPSVVMFSYTFIMETELRDIITIIEGKRYGLPSEEIKKLLIIYNLSEGSD